ncbi:sensor domain-containing protein [Mycobacterium sp. MYCO198283]|uniref:sensor domain-containing protein n=1 Tax=Mycobacterium sp. MYCO198283 TaxID=2883505 RepID=UPI001E3D3843|nr:sensor domain-containing protein [Mycobacterium sp. MYCO198283]MCG5434373.1 sensor domain-containing protein [Mycobacterium sp. MYCO198283]
MVTRAMRVVAIGAVAAGLTAACGGGGGGGGGAEHQVDVGGVLLDKAELARLTGAGDKLTESGGEVTQPADDEDHAKSLPEPCQFIYRDTAAFGTVAHFASRRYTVADPQAFVTETAAGYSDADAASTAFDALADTVKRCGADPFAPVLVGELRVEGESISSRTQTCGRSYRLIANAVVASSSCGFAAETADQVVSRLAEKAGEH